MHVERKAAERRATVMYVPDGKSHHEEIFDCNIIGIVIDSNALRCDGYSQLSATKSHA